MIGIRFKLAYMAVVARLAKKRCLYIDCGSNLGQGYTFFSRYLRPSRYDAILVEPNPNCMEALRTEYQDRSHIEFMESAAWVKDGSMKLYGLVEDSRGSLSDGASIVENHNSSMYKANKEGAIDVKTFSLAQLISGKAAEYDRIVLKLDIESAEYEVLQDLMDTGAAQSLVHIFVEFHSRFFSDDQRQHYKDQEIELVRRLRRLGVGVTIWR